MVIKAQEVGQGSQKEAVIPAAVNPVRVAAVIKPAVAIHLVQARGMMRQAVILAK